MRAALAAVLLVVFALGIGVSVGSRARVAPSPSPSPVATSVLLPSATPADPAETQRRAFAQPLIAGCSTGRAVWLVADGGALIRFDGRLWSIPDPTLRSLEAVACRTATALAVGGGGSIVTIDDDRRQVRVDRFGSDDLHALSLYADGALAVGDSGAVLQQTALDWRPVPAVATGALRGVFVPLQRPVAPGRAQAWVVGDAGASYRLLTTGWERVPTGTTATLRAVLQDGDVALAVGDDGTILRSASGTWSAVPAGTHAALRAVAIVGASTAWIVGDGGTVIELSGERARRVELGTACTLRAVFVEGSAIWVVGSDRAVGGAWRVTPTGTDHWGSC